MWTHLQGGQTEHITGACIAAVRRPIDSLCNESIGLPPLHLLFITFIQPLPHHPNSLPFQVKHSLINPSCSFLTLSVLFYTADRLLVQVTATLCWLLLILADAAVAACMHVLRHTPVWAPPLCSPCTIDVVPVHWLLLHFIFMYMCAESIQANVV